MSQRYPNRDSRSLEALRALENSIRRLRAAFHGANAVTFSHEIELAAYLMVWTRQAYMVNLDARRTPICLARLEWPCVKRRSIDLVLWEPTYARRARSQWGTPRGRLAKAVPLLAAIQVKRGGGRIATWSSMQKDIEDLEAVYASEGLGGPVLYALQWADESLRDDSGDVRTYREVKSKLKKWCSDAPQRRRALVISRDRVGFAYPRGVWLVDPLPPGTVEAI